MEKKKRSLPRFQITRNHLANFLTAITTTAIVIVFFILAWGETAPIPNDLFTNKSIRITISEGQRFRIGPGDPVRATAESKNYFIIDNGRGLLYSGLLDGFTASELYSTSFVIEPGIWTVREAGITLELTSDSPVSLTVFAVQFSSFVKSMRIAALTFLVIVLWFLSISLIAIIVWPKRKE